MSIARVHLVKKARQRFEKETVKDENGLAVRTPVIRKTGEPKKTAKGREITRRQTVSNKDKPLPNYTCNKCGEEIKVGDPYYWYIVGFRSGYKRIRCMKHYPKLSDLESTSKSSLYAAQEEFLAGQYESMDDIEGAFEGVKDAFQEYFDDCDSALESWENGNSMLEERRDAAEQARDECEWQPTAGGYDGEMKINEDGDEVPVDEDEFAAYIQEIVDEANDTIESALGNL